LDLNLKKNDRIAIIGRNGRGKTTLLNLLADELQPTSGSVMVNANSKLAYFGQTNISRLSLDKTIEQEILDVNPDTTRGMARTICGIMMFSGDAALKKVRNLSGGERSRVLLGKILVTPANLLFLDEPTNHLDMDSIDALADAVDEFDGAVVLVTHSELLLRRIPTRLVIFDRGNVQLFEGNYEDFLDRVGWEDEDSIRGSKKDKSKKAEKPKTESTSGSSSTKKEEKKIEDAIVALESKMEEKNALLIEASEKGDRDSILTLSQEISLVKEEIDDQFKKLEALLS
jgi:ATP-binding cassette, subfamily F, member 3